GIGPQPLSRSRLRADALAQALERITGTASMRDKARRLAVPLQRRNGALEAVRLLVHRSGE
ncbi:MAG TPA: hypothetical protein VLT88_12780, partial [Desulfosarcina sp.]|nr:hypothetical protein [Desulfosarcina sp.]